MAKYKKYSEYKDSGVDWLKSVPENWKLRRHKHLSKFHKGKNPSSLMDSEKKESLRYLSMDYLRGGTQPKYAQIEAGSYVTSEDQILIIWDGSNAGEFVRGTAGILSSTMAAAEMNYNMVTLFYWYACVCLEPEMRKHANGMGIPHVNGHELRNSFLPIPSETEQKQIARFLDHETGKIDRLIQKQQQLIELLKEKRQAVISHAVTKGLNPNAPLKPSNIEWLGDVPEHWEVAKIFHLSSRIGDGLHGTPKYEDGTGLYFVNGNNLESGSIVIGGSAKEVPMKDFEAYKVPLSERSVLLSINGTIGKVALYRNETVILGKSAAYINCLPALQPRFLMTFFESNHAKRYYTLVSSGTTISNLSLDAIRQFQICLPSTDEQDAIVNYADEQKEMYATLIASASKMASTLQERRTALISAAVTGKIDVRDWSPAGDESEEEKG